MPALPRLSYLCGFLLLASTATVATARASTTDIGIPYSTTGLYSGHWSNALNGGSLAAAPTNGNTGTGITFADWQGQFNEITPGQTTTFSIGNVALGSSSVVNTLFSNFYGDSNTDAVVTFTNSIGATQSFSLIGGKTIRDYNQNVFQNALTNGTPNVFAQTWFDNGIGQRLDLQSFTLSSSWASTNLVSMTVYNPTNPPDNPSPDDVLSALQVVSSPAVAVTPEPSSLVLLGTGLLGAAGAIRRRFRQTTA